jgi:hypothetical protein
MPARRGDDARITSIARSPEMITVTAPAEVESSAKCVSIASYFASLASNAVKVSAPVFLMSISSVKAVAASPG